MIRVQDKDGHQRRAACSFHFFEQEITQPPKGIRPDGIEADLWVTIAGVAHGQQQSVSTHVRQIEK